MQPTLAGFIDFIRTVMGVDSTVLPDNSPVIPMALSVALAIVNPALCAAGYSPGVPGTVPVSIYVLAVYNLGGDNIINYAQDVGNPPPDYKDNLPYFEYLRKQWNVNAFVSGVVQSSGDESTNVSLVVQEAAKNFTLSDLQNLKTPWGRAYLAFAQRYGEIIGIS